MGLALLPTWLTWLVSDKIVPSDFTYVISVIGVIDVIGVITFCKGTPFIFSFKKKLKKKITYIILWSM